MSRFEFWTIGVATIALILFVWVELSNDVQENAKAIADNAIAIERSRAEIVWLIARLETAMIRETYIPLSAAFRLFMADAATRRLALSAREITHDMEGGYAWRVTSA